MLISTEQRFWRKVAKTDSCWNWIGGKTSNGYGRFFDGRGAVRAHRYSWTMHNGPIPDGLLVCHSCDNPKCVNPDHLWLGNDFDNMADMRAKGRAKLTLSTRISDAQVIEIRNAVASGAKTVDLAARYGISYFHARHIVTGERREKVSAPA